MRTLAAAVLLVIAALSGPAWSQANIRPDPTPRVPPLPGQPVTVEDGLFLKEALEASRGQVELGRIAAGKASDEAFGTLVRGVAQTHATLAEALESLIRSRNLPPADLLEPQRADAFGAAGAVTNPANAQGGMVRDAIPVLSDLSGEAFARGYVDAQLRLYRRLVDLYQTEASNSPDRELSAFAITSLVTIQKDRDALRQMGRRFGLDVEAEGQAPQYGNPAKAR